MAGRTEKEMKEKEEGEEEEEGRLRHREQSLTSEPFSCYFFLTVNSHPAEILPTLPCFCGLQHEAVSAKTEHLCVPCIPGGLVSTGKCLT